MLVLKFKNPLRAAKPVAERRAAILESKCALNLACLTVSELSSMFYCGASQAVKPRAKVVSASGWRPVAVFL
nr:hypothetical protein [uncultured Campylobacter sp.]